MLDLGPILNHGDERHPRYRVLIDGEWRDPVKGTYFEVTEPATGDVIGYVPRLSVEEVERAIDAAHAAKKAIRKIPAIERIEILERARHLLESEKDRFIEMIVREAGKPIAVAKGEVHASFERMALTMEEARAMHGEYIPGDWVKDTVGKFAVVRREPRGVVAAITPFNYPLFIATAKIVPALVSGNSVVVKPSSEDPIVLLMLARVLEQAGVPKGALNIVTGRGREVGDTLASSPKIDMVTFTGSTPVGEHIARVAGMKKLHLELGGKGASLVLADANLDLAARESVRGALRFSGQRCDAVDRILVDAGVADAFVPKLLAEVAKYKIGDLRDPATQIGPLITPEAVKTVDALVHDATAKGAKLLAGGTFRGQFYEPTVLDHVTLDMRVAWEESFGPVIPILRVEGIPEMIRIANMSEYGLDASVFTNDLYKAFGIAKRLEDGEVTINGAPAHGVGHFPFGGNKKSGVGREGIGASIEEMTRQQTIVVNLPPASTPYGF